MTAVAAARGALPGAVLLALTGLPSCGPPGPTDVRFVVQAASTCQDPVPAIESVQIIVVGGRSGQACVESVHCSPLHEPYPQLIDDVQKDLSADPDIRFDLIANRGYEIATIGFGSPDCTVGSDFGRYRFCGISDPVRFDRSETVSVQARCGEDLSPCLTNTRLGFCQ